MSRGTDLSDKYNEFVRTPEYSRLSDEEREDYRQRYNIALVRAADLDLADRKAGIQHETVSSLAPDVQQQSSLQTHGVARKSHQIAQNFYRMRETDRWRNLTEEQRQKYTDEAKAMHRQALSEEGADQVPDTKLMVQQETMQHFMPPEEEEKRMAEFGLGTAGKSLGKGLLRAPGNLGSTLVAAGGVGADLLGKGMKAVGLDRAGSAVSDVGQGAINVSNMMDAWNKYYIPPEQSGPRNLQEFGDMTTGQKAVFLMDQIPEQVATMFLPGMLGAKAAQAAVTGAKGAKAAGVLKPLTGYLARKGPQSAQALGALVGSTVQSASEIGKSQMQEAGDTNALATLIAAPVAGKLESLVPASAEWLSGAFKGASRKAFTEAMKSPVKFLGHISKEMLKSSSTEAVTELLQESIQMYATEMAKGERGAGILDAAGTAIDILREKGIDGLIAEAKRNEAVGELAMAALLGGVAGGVFEGAGRTFAGARYLGSPVRHYDALISASTDEEKRAAANAWEKLTPLQRQQAREEAVYRSIFELDDPESDQATVDEALKVLRGIGHNEAQQYYATMAKSGWAPNEKHQEHLLDLWGKKNIEPATPQAPISPELVSESEGSGEQAAVMTSTEDTAPVMPTPLPEESRTPDDKTSLRPEEAASTLETQGHIASDGLSGLRGKKTKIRTPQGYEVDGEYRIVEADEGRNSFSEGYTSELQDRDTRKEDSRYQIEKIRDHVIPGELLPDFEGADIGAPIMGLNAADNQLEVEIGNHRDQAIREGYRHGTFDSYKQTLIDRAAIFGFDPDEVAKMRSPKLVRVRTTALDRENRKAFANSGNKPRSRVKNSAEKALTDAQYIAPALESLVVTADGDFNTAGNREFLREFIRAVAPTIEEQGDLIKDGALTQSGVNRVRNAIFAAAYGNASLVERLAENTDERIKRILSGMTSAAASTAVVRNEIAKGNLHDLQIADDVGKAADKLAELRKNGTSVDQYLSQGLFFDDGMTPESRLLLKIADKAKNIRVFADLITGFNGQVKALGDPKQGTLFEGQQLPTKLSLLEAVIERDYPELAAIKETVKKGQAIHEHQLNSDDAVKSSPESAYFSPTPEAQRIELARIRPGKQEESQSIANAKNFMQAAAAGQGDKRAPIDLVENDDGTYTVIDGNATAHAMNELGGSHVLAQVRGKNTGTRLGNSALIVKRQSPAGTLRADSIDRQNTEVGMNQLYQLAEENNPGLTELVNAAAKQSGGKAVMRPKIKDRTRVSEKAVKDYAGDAGRVTDVIGGTIVLPDTGDFNDAIKAIKKAGADVVQVKPFNMGEPGYGDIKVTVGFPNGGLGEIILVSEFMQDGKFNRGGHEVYDATRVLKKYADQGNEEALKVYRELKALENAIYDRDATLSDEDFERAKAKASSSLTRLLSPVPKNASISSKDISLLKSSSAGIYLASPAPVTSSYATPNLSLIQNDMGTSGSSVENSPSHTSIIPDSEVSDNNNIDQNPSIDNDNQNQPEVKLSKQRQSTEHINPEVERIAKLLDQLTDSKAAPKSQYEELVQLIENMTSSPSESVQAGPETQYEKVARLVEQLGGPAATSDSQQQAQLSKGSDQTQAMPREELDALADRIQNNLDSMHDLRIVPVESTQELSAKLKQEIPATVEGALVGKTVYLVRENLPDAKRATEVAGHEIIGHYGLPGILGREYQGFQKDFVNLAASDRSIADELKRAVRDYRGDKGMSDSRIIDEAIARTAERYAADPQGVSERARQWLDNLIAKVRDTLRVLGFDIKFDTRDLAQTIRASKSAVTRDDSFNSKSSGTELDGYEELAEETPVRGRLDHLVEQIGEELPAQHKETGNKLLDILLALGEDDATEGSQALFSRKKAQGKVAGSPEQRTLVDLLNELDGIPSDRGLTKEQQREYDVERVINAFQVALDEDPDFGFSDNPSPAREALENIASRFKPDVEREIRDGYKPGAVELLEKVKRLYGKVFHNPEPFIEQVQNAINYLNGDKLARVKLMSDEEIDAAVALRIPLSHDELSDQRWSRERYNNMAPTKTVQAIHRGIAKNAHKKDVLENARNTIERLGDKEWFDKAEAKRYMQRLTSQFSGRELTDEQKFRMALNTTMTPYSREDRARLKPFYSKASTSEAKAIFEETKNTFGLTDSLSEAGYVLPDGSMLDFSGRHEGYGESGERTVDHRDIDWTDAPGSGNDRMTEFMRQGAIRVDGDSGIISVHGRNEITPAQRRVLRKIVDQHDTVWLDLEDDSGKRAGLEVRGGWKKVEGALNRWQAGTTPKTGVMFSRGGQHQPEQLAQTPKSQLEQIIESLPDDTQSQQTKSKLEEILDALPSNDDTRFSYAGRRAKARPENVSTWQEAKKRLNAGEDAETVRRETGWFINPYDQKPRFEISDRDSRFKGRFLKGNHADGLLKDNFDHPSLFAAYPFLKRARVSIGSMRGLLGGACDTTGRYPFIRVIAPNLYLAKEALIHELQHAIQVEEGFAQGGNPDMFSAETEIEAKQRGVRAWRREADKIFISASDEFKSVVRRMNRAFDSRLPRNKQSDEYIQARKQLMEEFADEGGLEYVEFSDEANRVYLEQANIGPDGREIKPLSQYDQYHRLAGEIEARDAEERMSLGAESRRDIAPFSGVEYMPEDVITRFSKSEAEHETKRPMANNPLVDIVSAIGEQDVDREHQYESDTRPVVVTDQMTGQEIPNFPLPPVHPWENSDMDQAEASDSIDKYLADLDEYQRRIEQWANDTPDVLRFAQRDGDLINVVSRDTYGDKPWRVTIFQDGRADGRGVIPSGHSAFNSKADAIIEASRGSMEFAPDMVFSKAYHGSPHRGIEKEGFRLNKIGSGEGAQAYGWGMYFAGNRNVAEDYRKRLADWGSSGSYTFEGRQFQSDDYTSPERHAISHAYHNGVNAARKLARDILADAKAGKPHAMELGGIEYAQKMLDTANAIKRKTDITFEQGQLYSAEIPDSHELLDWDKSLSEQTEGVREAIQEAVELLKENGWPGDQVHDPLYELNAAIRNNGSGKDIYHALQDIAFDRTKFQVSEDAPRHASEFLQSVGIPGMRYLDGNSRGRGEGTHNYVIWDESRLNDDIQTYYSKKRSDENKAEMAEIETRAKADGTWLKAPNGQESKLNARQWTQTRTQAFKNWFGDWENDPENASVIVDRNGEPLILWRGEGGGEDFGVFDRRKTREKGFFFTPSKPTADMYANGNASRAFYLRANKPFRWDSSEGRAFIQDWAQNWDEWVDRYSGETVDPYEVVESGRLFDYEGDWSGERWRDLQSSVEDAGYDLVVLPDYHGDEVSDSYIAFKPNQIKSATDNIGTFDADNPDIRFSKQAAGDTFYSEMERVLAKQGMLPKKASKDVMIKAIQNHVGKFKKVELDESGLIEHLQGMEGEQVTNQDVTDYLDTNKIEIREEVKQPLWVVFGIDDEKKYFNTRGGAEQYIEAERDWIENESVDIDYSDENITVTDHNNEVLFEAYRNEDGDWVASGTEWEEGQVMSEKAALAAAEEAAERTREAYRQEFIDAPELDDEATKYSDYQVPGGKNYRELLLTLPRMESDREKAEKSLKAFTAQVRNRTGGPFTFEDMTSGEMVRYDKLNEAVSKADLVAPTYKSLHWPGVRNPLMHIRFNEREDLDGNRVLFVEEIQSDWHQDGRKKGYSQELDVPEAPFKNTDRWAMLGMKRMIRWAAENGFDKIAWTPGSEQAKRYDLSKHVDRIGYTKRADGLFNISAARDSRAVFAEDAISKQRLSDLVGEEMADKINREEGHVYDRYQGNITGELTGLDLKVGGEGMKSFYDSILKNETAKYIKKFGGKVGQVEIFPAGENDFYRGENLMAHGFDITPKIKDAALAGQPYYSKASQNRDQIIEQLDPSPEPLPTLTEETRAQAGKVMSAMQQLASGLLGKTMSQRDRDDAAFQRAQAINPEADTNYELTESGKIDEAVKTSAYQDATILSHLDADKNLITAMIRKLTPEGDLQDWLLKKAARVLAPYQAGKPIERLLFTVGENVAWDGEKIVESPGIRTYNQETGEYEYTEGQHTKAAMHFFNTLSPEWKELMTKRAQTNEEYRQHFVDVVVPHRKAQVAIALLARYRQMNADKSALEGAEAEARSMLTALDGKINKAEHNELKALLENVVKIPADRVAKMVVSLESIIRQATGELKTPAQLQRELKLLNSNRGHYGYVHHFFENDPAPSQGRAFDAFGRVPNGWIEDVPGSQKLRTGAEGYERNLLKADLARKGKEVKSEAANNWMRQVEDQRGLLVEEFQEADFMPEGYEARQRVVANFGKYRGQEIYLPDNIYDHYKLVKQNGLQDPGMKEFSEIVQMVDGFTNRVNEALLFHPGKFARDLISVPFHLMEFVRDWSVKNPLEAPFMVMALTKAIGKSMTPETWQKNTPESFGEYSESQVYQNKDGDKSFLTKAGDAAGRLFMPGVPLGSTVAAFLRELNLSGSADLPIKRIMKSVGEQIADRRGLKGKARERFVFDMINDYAFITSDLPFMLSYLRGQRPTKGSKAWGAFMRTTIPFLGYSSRMVKQMVADPVSKGILPMAKRLVGKQGADANFLHEFSEASRPFAWLFLKSLVSAGLGGLIPPEKEGLASEVQNAKWLDPTARTHGRILISQDEDPKGGEYWMSTDGYGQLQVADLLDQITRGKTTVKDFATEFFTIHPTMQFLMGQLGIEDAYSAQIPVTAKLGRVIAQAMIPQLIRFGPELAKFFRAVAGNNTIPDAKKQNFFTGFFERLGIPAGEVKVDRDGKLRVSKNGIEALKMAGVNIRHIPYDMIAEAAEGELSGIDYLAKRLEMIQEYRDGDRDSDLSEREFIAQTLKTDRWSNLDDASRDITEELVERGHGTLATIAKLRKKGVPITERKKPAQKKSSQFGGGFKNTFGSGFSSGFGRKPSQLSAEEKYEKKVLTAEEIIKSIEVETAKQPKGWREQLGEWINKL